MHQLGIAGNRRQQNSQPDARQSEGVRNDVFAKIGQRAAGQQSQQQQMPGDSSGLARSVRLDLRDRVHAETPDGCGVGRKQNSAERRFQADVAESPASARCRADCLAERPDLSVRDEADRNSRQRSGQKSSRQTRHPLAVKQLFHSRSRTCTRCSLTGCGTALALQARSYR
jgi:hypothetical protein